MTVLTQFKKINKLHWRLMTLHGPVDCVAFAPCFLTVDPAEVWLCFIRVVLPRKQHSIRQTFFTSSVDCHQVEEPRFEESFLLGHFFNKQICDNSMLYRDWAFLPDNQIVSTCAMMGSYVPAVEVRLHATPLVSVKCIIPSCVINHHIECTSNKTICLGFG